MEFWVVFILIALIILTAVAAVYLVWYLHSTDASTLAKWSSIWILLLLAIMVILVVMGITAPSDCAQVTPLE